jgi:transposase
MSDSMRGRPISLHVQFPPEFLELATKIARRRKVDYRLRQRAALVCLLATEPQVSQAEAAARVSLTPCTVFRWRQRWANGDFVLEDKAGRGRKPIFAPCGPNRAGNDEAIKKALFTLLHSPPSAYDINRTSWKLDDLPCLLHQQGVHITKHTIRRIVFESGYRWRKAREVLTSNDPKYKEKMARIHTILSTLSSNDRFFSIDEYGPFSIGKRGGRALVAPGETPIVPQRQQYKGVLIVTAGLELSTNQVTHFYSERKNSGEMTKLLNVLLEQYSACDNIYLSWDAASWHASKELYERMSQVNDPAFRSLHGTPLVGLAPLPSNAQFLNVIESVFSGMARAIIHNSDYQSEGEAQKAIDRYFAERNSHYLQHPKRAGDKIWWCLINIAAFLPFLYHDENMMATV